MKKYIVAVFVVILSVTCFASYSFGIDKGKKLLANSHCPRCDLRSADLRSADLREADLRGAFLIEANLEGADLSKANLTNTDLTEANLERAENLNTADTTGAIFCRTIMPDASLNKSGC